MLLERGFAARAGTIFATIQANEAEALKVQEVKMLELTRLPPPLFAEYNDAVVAAKGETKSEAAQSVAEKLAGITVQGNKEALFFVATKMVPGWGALLDAGPDFPAAADSTDASRASGSTMVSCERLSGGLSGAVPWKVTRGGSAGRADTVIFRYDPPPTADQPEASDALPWLSGAGI